MLECYITLRREGLPGINALAYWANLKVTKGMMCCEYSSGDCNHNNSVSSELMNGPNKLEYYIALGYKDLQWKTL